MNLPRSKRFWNEMPLWLQASIIVAVWMLISLMYPRGVRFDYSFEQGQRWRHRDLIAPFDYPLRKSDTEIEAERRRIRDNADPYYLFETDAGVRAIARYRERFAERLDNLATGEEFPDLRQRPDRYLRKGAQIVVSAFERGIVAETPKPTRVGDGVVRIVRGGTITEADPNSLVTLEAARQHMTDSLRASRLADAGFLLPILQSTLAPNILYSDSLTQRFAETRLNQIVESRGMVRQGEVIVLEGGIITGEIFQRLRSYKVQYESEVVDVSRHWWMYFGYVLLTGVVMSLLLLYLLIFHAIEFRRFNRLAFLMLLLGLCTFAVYRIEELSSISIYLMPFVLLPIVVKSFYPPGVALFTHLVAVLIAGFISSLGYEFAFLQMIAGIVAVLLPMGTQDWSRIIRSMLILAATYFIGFVGLELVKDGSWQEIDWGTLSWLALSLFLSLLAYPLVPLFGRLFGFTSEIVYQELSDVNRPILRELALRAPGTFQHSLAVSNLAESAVREIGGDAMLVKVAALYHDIGKLVQPAFYIENQSGRNPHEGLDERESARIIISHVPEGIRIAEEAHLPAQIIEFIATHHGTTRVEYFYRTYVNKHPDEQVDSADFRYPGPLPLSREQGVLMMADSVEAASRAVKDPTAESIENLVDSLIDAKIALGQFSDCALSFRELEVCRELFKRMLKSMYHARLVYPSAVATVGEG